MNILVRTLLAGFMACPFLNFAQNNPLFQFSLYFEDTVGNKDSVIIGYDPTASSQNLNPQFGEVWLTTPFDSVFDVRVIHGGDSQNRTSKKAIGHMEFSLDSCVLGFHTKIIINAKFLPVKITYDSTLFPIDDCKNVILSPHWGIFTLPDWWDACKCHCMAGSSGYVEDFVIPPPIGFCANVLKIEKVVEGQGPKILKGLFFAMFYGPGPCNDTTFLAVQNDTDIGFGTLNPNPVDEHFSVRVPTDGNVFAMMSDLTGRLITCPFTLSADTIEFDARSLSPGVYFIALQAGQSSRAVYKFIKM